MKNTIISKFLNLSMIGAAVLSAASCTEEIDNEYSRFRSSMEITASEQSIILDESKADETALTVQWTPAIDYGDDFIMTYEFTVNVLESTATAKTEYEDAGMFVRTWTHRELQKLFVNDFGCQTSTKSTIKFTVTASYVGPYVVMPEQSSVEVSVKTYGPKQFAADQVFMGGTAVGGTPVQLTPSASNPSLYVYNGNLTAGKLNFPVVYGDENNVIVPASGDDEQIGEEAMDATVLSADESDAAWIIPTSESYRVTLNFATQTVMIIPSSQIFEFDAICLGGSSAPEEETFLTQTLENASLYAFRGELKAGVLYMPVVYQESTSMAVVPSSSQELADGQAAGFTTTSVSMAEAKGWNIPADGIYRIVLDADAKTVTIWSPETDMKNKVVSYNNTVDGINPYTQEVTALWMYGTFNGFAHDSGLQFEEKYKLTQSLANPYVFTWWADGAALPRQTGTFQSIDAANGDKFTGGVNFYVSNIQNNVYAYGSTAEAVRNSKTAAVAAELGKPEDAVEGQANNRYALFLIPEGANFVVVDIDKLTVTFEKR